MSIRAPWNEFLAEPLRRDHIVQLYRDERFVVEAVALFAGQGLGKGESVVLVAIPEHLAAIEASLTAADFPVEGLKRRGQLTLVDADQLLSRFMRNDEPDAALFRTVVGDVIEGARADGRYPSVRVYGEMVNLLWRWNLAAATRLEELWNDLIQAHSVSLFCAYSLDKRDPDAPREFPPTLRALHTHVIPVEAGA